MDTVTREAYAALDTAYSWFNQHLFGGRLPACLITFQRSPSAQGYFWARAVKRRRGKRRTDEIALNPAAFVGRTDKDILSTLVHEMVHLWQSHCGRPGRRGYHNREWADKMEAVGLGPSVSGAPGGARTGERVSHYVIAGGPFERAWDELHRTGFRLRWEAPPPPPAGRNKRKYACPRCGLSVWGKPGLERHLACVACRYFLVAAG